ncbi:MAG TPA: hypothetical protein VGU02_08280 [Gaiellaceae bacterium]|nr:hypothetical protein [Gaiellaceae bacterium]
MPRVEQRIDALYGLPLAEFTPARNALARELKDDDIRALAKPSQIAWAINQAARTDTMAVRRLFKAADALRAAQEKSLAGKDADLAGAQQHEREAVRALARSAVAALGGSTHLDRIERTLSAAALDLGARKLLQAGRLTEEIAPSGFGALAGIKLPPARPKRAATPKRDEEKEQRRRALRKEAQAAERRALAAERAAAEARREADEAAAALAELDP